MMGEVMGDDGCWMMETEGRAGSCTFSVAVGVCMWVGYGRGRGRGLTG